MQLLLIVFLFFATTFCFVKSDPPSNAISCSDRYHQVDGYFSEILGFGSVEQRFPENRTQLKAFCSNQHRLITALNDYREECLSISGSDRRKQIFTLAIHSLRHWNGRICGGHSKLSRQLVTSASCANAAANGYRRCWNGFTDLLKSSKNQETGVQKATLCCAYHRTLECMREVGMGVRPELTCSETSVDLHQQYVQLLMGGSVEVVCAAFDEVTDRCDRLVWKPYKRAAGRKEAKKLWKKKVYSNEKFLVNFHQSSSSGEIVQLKPFFNLMLDTLSARA